MCTTKGRVMLSFCLSFVALTAGVLADSNDPVRGVIRVRKDGKGDFKFIQEAIAYSKDGDIIEIQDNSVYRETLSLENFPGRTLKAKEGTRPVLDGWIRMGDRCVLDGLTIKPSGYQPHFVQCLHYIKTRAVIRNCVLDARATPPDASGNRPLLIIVWHNASNVLIENNRLSGGYYAVYVEYPCRGTVIRNNVIWDGKPGGIRVKWQKGQPDLNTEIVNNTFYNSPLVVEKLTPRGVSVFKNNIIANCHVIVGTGAGITKYNCFFDIRQPLPFEIDPTNIEQNPCFASPQEDDFHLKSRAGRWDPQLKKWVRDEVTSPCIDAGDPKSHASLEPNGSRINLGAYGNTYEASRSEGKVNIAPSPPQIAIDPPRIQKGDSLSCIIKKEALDPDGDKVSYVYRWYRNKRLMPGLTKSSVPGERVLEGDLWMCQVVATDGNLVSKPAVASARVEGKFHRPDYQALRKKYGWLQEAVDSLPPEGGTVKVPAGTHSLRTGIVLTNRKNIHIKGQGPNKTILKAEGGFSIFVADDASDIRLEGMTLLRPGEGDHIQWRRVKNSTISDMEFRGHRLALHLWQCEDCTFTRNKIDRGCFYVFSSRRIIITDNTIVGTVNSIQLNSGNLDCVIERNHLTGGGGIFVYSASMRNRIANNVISGVQNGVELALAYDNIIENNIFKGCRGGGAIYFTTVNISNSVGNIIRNNIIYNCPGGALKFAVNSPRPGKMKRKGEPNWVINNIIYGNKFGIDWTVASRYGYSELVLRNNIIAKSEDFAVKGFEKGLSTLRIDYNNFWRNGVNYVDCSAGEGNISKDPLFADAENADFHLKSEAGRWEPKSKKWLKDKVTSPCIDAGDPKDDFSKEPEPNGGRINLGAYGNTPEASMSSLQ